MNDRLPVTVRAARHAALGDPVRLAIVDALTMSDRAPIELGRLLDVPSNLLAHHLDVLEGVGLITRARSSGDGRRRYVRIVCSAIADIGPASGLAPRSALFVCTRNSARSQLAEALWHQVTNAPACSAGTHPAEQVDPGAVAAAGRAGLDIGRSQPRSFDALPSVPSLVITVCDEAHEELGPHEGWLHWSVADPVASRRPDAFDSAIDELRERICNVTLATGRSR